LDLADRARFNVPLFEGQAPDPPGTVVGRLQVSVWYAEDAFEARYVLLDDGTVWRWEYDRGAYLTFTLLAAGPVAGALLACVSTTVVWVRHSWKKRAYS
jgi:hypothetical protein